jgi:hypothetical protein
MTTTIINYKDLTTDIQRMWNVKNSYANNNNGNWNHLKIIQEVPEQHTGEA